MKCQLCSNPATVHLTNIENNKKQEVHLCQKCAEAQQLIKKQELNLPAILQTLIGQHVGPWTDELARLTCPACGIRYMEFRAAGRLGCPHDYNVFRVGLEPLLNRIHRTTQPLNNLHLAVGGKRPKRAVSLEKQAELFELRRRLRAAVEAEAYEEAARLRDLLRQKESHG